ncbi:hypothetical protein ABEB36_002478 [Hypothenemus hampei]|uniref:Condensin complex subunit 1 n=1 Tax=Hypothenemus hampei TaxID=57062 RepID=A0ABD1F9I6_HYPHA
MIPDFVIPSKSEELLTTKDGCFSVEDIINVSEISKHLKTIKSQLRENGPECILEHLDIFYSALQNADDSTLNIIEIFNLLHTATVELKKTLGFLLEDVSTLSEEDKQKYQSLIKMLIYFYVQIILAIEEKNCKNPDYAFAKKTKKPKCGSINLDKMNVLLVLDSILQLNIAVLWDPPVVEDNLTSLISEICYRFLQNPLIKGEKEVKEQLFHLMGTIIKLYNHGTTFPIRIGQMIRDEEHLIQCLPDGIKMLVEDFNCSGLVHALVQEITEWQTDEKCQDSQGSRFCAQFLTELAVKMPTMMLPEVLYLNRYLGHESATLRNSILNVITEVIIHVLTNHQLTEDESKYRDEFLTVLFEHMKDNSAHVRSRVIQHWGRLQAQNAIPKELVNELLEKVINYHVHDKAASVRKCAVNCVTTLLSHNAYSSDLSLLRMKQELQRNEASLNELQPKINRAEAIIHEAMERLWDGIVPTLKNFLLKELNTNDEAGEIIEMNSKDAKEIIRIYLSEKKFKEAYLVWKLSNENKEDNDENKENIIDDILTYFKSIYMERRNIGEKVNEGFFSGEFTLTEDDYNKYVTFKEKMVYLTETINFIEAIHKAVKLITELLDTPFMNDLQEAVSFFIVAYQFKIDNINDGIIAMFKVLKKNEPDRRDLIINAFKTIYLTTDSSNMNEHCTTIIKRLIILLKNMPDENIEEFELVISEWVGKGMIDNGIICMLWEYFSKKNPVSDEDCHASVELLRMAAIGRRSIVMKNIKLVSVIAFGNMGRNNLAFLGSCCRFLAVAGLERVDITSSKPSFKISHKEAIFQQLYNILFEKFVIPDEFYYHALSGAMEFIYKVSDKPDSFWERFVQQIVEKLVLTQSSQDQDVQSLDRFQLIRLCQLLGLLAVNHLDYLDETVYKEQKRREYCRQANKAKNIKNFKKTKRTRNSTKDELPLDNSTIQESFLEGAQAEDEDAEFIVRILEKFTVTGPNPLAELSDIIVQINENQNAYNDVHLQGAASIALLRYMLVSSEFCLKHIRLLFTIFEKTKFSEVKISILVHLPDLFSRFPNIIEPWTSNIFERLKDPSVEIRRATFFTLSCLILRDMVRAHCNVPLMAYGLIDVDQDLNDMSRTFFITFSKKENNLYNILPDLFSQLISSEEIAEEKVREIMKFLFDLMDKSKHNENLVDRFCAKFPITDNVREHRNVAYCLSLITYNDKSLRKLNENFNNYKNMLHDNEIYSSFKNIMQNCVKHQVGRTDLKPIVQEIENKIKALFEVDEIDDKISPKPTQKNRKQKRRKRRRSSE